MNILAPRQKYPGREKGFVTMCVLLMGIAVFLILGGAIHANYRLHEWNRKHNIEIAERAAKLEADTAPRIPPGQPPPPK